MGHTPVGVTTSLAGTTWTTVAGPPSSGKRHAVVSLLAFNLDEARQFYLRRKKGAVTTLLVQDYLIGAGMRDQMIKDGMIVLDDTDETLEMRTDDDTAATQPVVEAAVMEHSA